MDVVASAASVAQLLGQAIILIQQIQQARETMRGYPKLLEGHTGQLNDLLNTLRLIEEEKELQTAGVVEQLAKVLEISQELQSFLGKVATWQTTSATRQYVHAIGSAKRDEKEMVGILDRLDRAKNELDTRILLAQVGLTGTLRDGFAVMLPTIQRTDRNVKRVLNARLSIAAQLEGRQSAERDGTLPFNDADLKTIGLAIPANVARDERSYIGNLTFDQAQMINGDVGAVTWQRATKLEYRNNEARNNEARNNEARNNSLQVNGSMDSQSFQALLAGRK